MEQKQGRLLSVQVGTPQTRETDGTQWTSAIFKAPVAERLFLDEKNLTGDMQANTKLHGGVDKAVCCFPSEHYPFWQGALNLGEAFGYGAFGENFTLEGLTETSVCIGDVYAVGTARVQVSQTRVPCLYLARKWDCPEMPQSMKDLGHSGFYLRVLETGEVGAGDEVTLLERPHPEISVAVVNDALFRHIGGAEMDALLATLPALSEDSRGLFRRRLT